MTSFPTDAEVFAAARELFKDLDKLNPRQREMKLEYDKLDPIGKDEFDAVVERILMATDKGAGLVEAGARQLYREGGFYGWWGNEPLVWDHQGYEKLNSEVRQEFDAVVQRLLAAAAAARQPN